MATPRKIKYGLTIALLTVSTVAIIAYTASNRSTGYAPANLTLLNINGGWTWFNNKRVIFDAAQHQLLFSSISNSAGSDKRKGHIDITSYHLDSRQVTHFTLNDTLQVDDDHNSAALYLRPDGRILAMYATHTADDLLRWRISKTPGDISNWEEERSVSAGDRAAYSNLIEPDRQVPLLYNFTRSIGFDPNFLVSSDNGSTWNYGGRLLDDKRKGRKGRPYVLFASDNAGRIHMIATDDHPRDMINSIHHGVIIDEQLQLSDGNVADANIFDSDAVPPKKLSTIKKAAPGTRQWIQDIAIDADKQPYIAFSARKPVSSNADTQQRTSWMIDYYYGRFDGKKWQTHFLAHGGLPIYKNELDYSGLVALDPANPLRVFISANADPASGAPLISRTDNKRHYEIFEGRSNDAGKHWTWSAVTQDSTQDNIRPVAVAGKNETYLLWLRGTYKSFKNYALEVVGSLPYQSK